MTEQEPDGICEMLSREGVDFVGASGGLSSKVPLFKRRFGTKAVRSMNETNEAVG